jgi:hypothetical protein
MQAKLIQEDKIDGGTVYYTEIDGHYVSNSLSSKFEEAERLYHLAVKHGSLDPKKTVLRIASVILGSSDCQIRSNTNQQNKTETSS